MHAPFIKLTLGPTVARVLARNSGFQDAHAMLQPEVGGSLFLENKYEIKPTLSGTFMKTTWSEKFS